MMAENIAATATATTHTITQAKFSVQLATPKTKTQSSTLCGIAAIIIELAKNATASGKL